MIYDCIFMSVKPCATTSVTAPDEHYYFGFRSCHNRNKLLPEYVTINIEWPLWVMCFACIWYATRMLVLHFIQCYHLVAFSWANGDGRRFYSYRFAWLRTYFIVPVILTQLHFWLEIWGRRNKQFWLQMESVNNLEPFFIQSIQI